MLIIMVIQIRNGNKSIHTDKEKLKEAIIQAIDESGYENKSPREKSDMTSSTFFKISILENGKSINAYGCEWKVEVKKRGNYSGQVR